MGIFELTPSIRQDTEFFSKALDELGMSKTQFNRKLKRMGISLSDNASKTNFLNNELKKIGSPLKYKNIITSRAKSAVETGMGGVEPGKVGAPNNAKIWKDGTKIQKTAIKKFPDSVTKQRKYFVDTMKKIYGNIPKKKILDLFKRTITGIKNFSPMGMMQELSMDYDRKKSGVNKYDAGNTEPMTFNEGGMMNINEMIRPISMQNGGDPVKERMEMLKDSMRDDENKRMVQPDVTSVALKIAQQQGDTSEANINKIIRQLMAMVPSVNQTMKDELTPTMNKGITGLLDKIGVMMGQKSDPKLNRNVGFSRVR
jgi:hypothetical protein